MEKRETRVYYFEEKVDRKAILVFDAGHEGGDIYIYEHKETLPASELKNLLRELGHHISWRLESP